MKTKPVSIIICAYNAENEITRILNSVLNQDYKGEMEIIVTDDCSKDSTPRIIEEYMKKHDNIRLMRNKKNKGVGRTLNKAIKTTKHDIVIVFHQDMELPSKNYITKVMRLFEDEEVVACQLHILTPESFWEKYDFWHRVFTVNFINPELKNAAYLLAFRKKVMISVGLFDSNTFTTAGEDLDMYMKLTEIGKVLLFDELPLKHFEGAHRASLKKQFLKQYQYGEAHGVNFRRYGFKISGINLILLKTMLLASLLVPFLNIPSLLILLAMGALPLIWTLPKIKDWRLVFFPFINVVKYAVYTYAFWKGFLTGKADYKY